ncbi:MAG TPA: glucose-1-phosphate thymidylyltransferase [Gemmatimonas aurantiaca]|uniref:Glucose-1-phosphate thymidylyltransferase n=1 Tax=Gemmatimonas aurantiaca TaxID=173480 RepID=A0A3D4VBH9_9BACT|nr:glucose-1-phosphate thymidylyltransferase [Gemmatimonas aurantiaca]
MIMARGLGTRMRRADASAALNSEQDAAASTGTKGLIPIRRPFLEYLVSALADAGIEQVVLVVGPAPDPIRAHFTTSPPRRVTMAYAEQPVPIGTADAVVRAAAVVNEPAFLVLNADNYYPVAAYAALAAESRAGTVAFDRDVLVRDGNIDADRVRAYAVLDVGDDETLRGIVEKPGDHLDIDSEAARWVGMNLWAITPPIVDACRRVPQSARGEFELPEAVALALHEGADIRAIRMSAPVLDLSQRRDIASVTARLLHIEPKT